MVFCVSKLENADSKLPAYSNYPAILSIIKMLINILSSITERGYYLYYIDTNFTKRNLTKPVCLCLPYLRNAARLNEMGERK